MATQLYRTLTGQSQRSDHSGTSTHKVQPTPTNTSSTTDPLTGTLNHLTLKQEAALEDFKDRLEKQGWWVRDVNNGKPSHDDGTLLYELAYLISERAHANQVRRYLRARKFDINGAVGQFTETEKWMKSENVEELYEHFDVDFYEKARTMVKILHSPTTIHLTNCSTHNGQDIEISEAYHSISMSSSTSTARMCRSTRKSPKHTRRICRTTKAPTHPRSCFLCLRYITIYSTLYFRCALPSNDLIPKYLSRIRQISSISRTSAWPNSGI